MDKNTLDNNFKISLVCEASFRFCDMIHFMEELAKNKKDSLNSDERNLISNAYKNAIFSRRKALKTINNLAGKKDRSEYLDYILEYKKKLQKELIDFTENVILKIDKLLIPKAKDSEAKVLYSKLKGDYYRYIAENLELSERKIYADNALKSYSNALEYSKNLGKFNPIRLGLALNLSVFYFEILRNSKAACQISSEALELIIDDLPKIEEDEIFKDSLDVINLMKDNLLLWNEGKNRKTSMKI